MEAELKKIADQGSQALSVGDLEKAKSLYTTVYEQDPESTDVLYALGTIAYQEKDYQTSMAMLGKAAELEPEAVDIAFNYASCLATVGDRLGALFQLKRATEHCRDDAYFVPRIADMSIRLGEPAAAVTLLSRLQRLLPADQIILANAQGMLGNWREAVNGLKYLHKSLPDDAVVAEKLAMAASKLRDYPTSISSFERYLQLVQPTSKDYLRFADLLLITQNSERSSQALDISIEKGEDSAEAFMLRARIERLRGNQQAVLSALEEVLNRQKKNGQAWQIKSELATDEELDNFIDTLEEETTDIAGLQEVSKWHLSLLHYSIANLYERKQNYEKAAAALASANQLQYQELELSGSFYSAEASKVQTDRTIATFGKEAFTEDTKSASDVEATSRPIFILGMPRSGTTLVERILGQNENVYCAGEQEGMEFVANHFKHQTLIERLPQVSEVSQTSWNEMRAMYLEKLPDFSKPIFTDKLPHNFRNVGFILKMFPDAKIIQMHRDPRDVCLSIYERAFAPGHNYANRWQDLMHFHAQADTLMHHWSSLESSQILDLQYEGLVTEPELHVKQLLEFVGFNWDKSYLDFHQSTHKSFTFSEMQVREPISKKRIGRWQNYADFIPELKATSTD